MTATKTEKSGVSCVILAVETEAIKPVVAQLEKLIDVFEVHVQNASNSLERESESTTQQPLEFPTLPRSLWAQADGVS